MKVVESSMKAGESNNDTLGL